MINIIVVDDNDKKLEEILDCFPEEIHSSIDIAKSANAAQNFFSQKIYDLAIIDLALPKRDHGKPIDNEGVELIQSINEFDWFKKPKRILAITQYDQLEEKYAAELKEYGVTLHFHNGTKKLNDIIYYQYELILKANEQIEYVYDLAIIYALEEEALPLVSDEQFKWKNEVIFGLNDLRVKTCTYNVGNSNYRIALIVLPRMGLVTSAITTTRVINHIKPKNIVMPGICAGVEGEVNIGDIIVANPSWEWQTGKWKGESFAIEPYQINASPDILRRLNSLAETDFLRKIWASTNHKRPDTPPKLYIGPMVSGSSVISSENMMQDLKLQHRKLLGLEMEIFGLYAACINSHVQPKFVSFKTVCDFGNETKGDNFHAYCCEVSAFLCKELISKL
ncbi:hypothetical protein ABKU27_18085 [Enterobacter hormaechei]